MPTLAYIGAMKICRLCGAEKPIADFNRYAAKPDGLDNRCKLCVRALKRAEYLRNRRGYIERAQRAYAKDKDAKHEYDRAYRQRNAERLLAQKAVWISENVEKVRQIKADYKKRNPHKGRADAMKRKARKRMAQPAWLTPEQIWQIEEIYRQAASRDGGPWHVDHIVPLAGKTVCGLHVPWNLRIVSVYENVTKQNKLIPELCEQINA